VITTKVDGQFGKAGFDSHSLFAPQGDYGKFQCDRPCCDSLYENHTAVQQMVDNTDQNSLLPRQRAQFPPAKPEVIFARTLSR
jgi:NAD-dependent SIR2 family protein deacetylase